MSSQRQTLNDLIETARKTVRIPEPTYQMKYQSSTGQTWDSEADALERNAEIELTVTLSEGPYSDEASHVAHVLITHPCLVEAWVLIGDYLRRLDKLRASMEGETSCDT